jgi:hypothetical protein
MFTVSGVKMCVGDSGGVAYTYLSFERSASGQPGVGRTTRIVSAMA